MPQDPAPGAPVSGVPELVLRVTRESPVRSGRAADSGSMRPVIVEGTPGLKGCWGGARAR
jgi:hypothetical protein